jgi:hypothetical protein
MSDPKKSVSEPRKIQNPSLSMFRPVAVCSAGAPPWVATAAAV